MTFSVISSDLVSRLSAVSRCIAGKNAMPVLDNFLFRVEGSELFITGSDGDTTIVARLPVNDVDGQGSIAIPVKTIMDPLRELSQQTLTISINESDLNVKVDYFFGSFEFVGCKASEYPVAREVETGANVVHIPAQKLLSGIQHVFFAVGEDELRPVMSGIYVAVANESVSFVASDSKRLVRDVFTIPASGVDGSFILPRKPANIIKGIIGKSNEDIETVFDAKQIRFSWGDYRVICRQIEGRYPRYEAIIPKSNKNIVTADRNLLLSALKRISVFSDNATNLVKFSIQPDKITISAQDFDFSTSGKEEVKCTYDGTPMDIGFRASSMVEILNTIVGSDVVLSFSEPSRPCIAAPATQASGEDILLLIVPMAINY